VLAPLLQLRFLNGSSTMTSVPGMPEDPEFKGASPNAHFLVGEMPAPAQLKTRWWQSTGASIVIHSLILGALIYAYAHREQIVQVVTDPTKFDFIIVQPTPGPSGGGGGSKPDPAPPRKIELKAAKPPEPIPTPKPVDVPTPQVTVPVQTAAAVQTLPGTLSPVDTSGIGTGGAGRGTGIGAGTGSGVGPGTGGGIGGGAFQPGSGITNPQLIREVKPNYTGDAMRAKLQGVVEMTAIVLPDGSVDPNRIRITRSLDSTFGLDQQAIIAVKQWRFRPGTCARRDGCLGIPFGQPVPVEVSVELTFTLR
jgi:periplasmic protein TonB